MNGIFTINAGGLDLSGQQGGSHQGDGYQDAEVVKAGQLLRDIMSRSTHPIQTLPEEQRRTFSEVRHDVSDQTFPDASY